jgi:electron transport complex protein RnfA
MSTLLPILFGAVLINVLVLEDAAGLRLFGEGSEQISDLLLGCVVIGALLASAVIIAYPIDLLLPQWELDYLRPLLLTFLIVTLIELANSISRGGWLQFSFPRARMGFIVANAALLSVAMSAVTQSHGLVGQALFALMLGALFALAIAAFAAIAYRLRTAETPARLRGLPIAAISAGVLCLAVTALAGLFR